MVLGGNAGVIDEEGFVALFVPWVAALRAGWG